MIPREDLKAQALAGSPKALVDCLTLLKKDNHPGQRSSIFTDFIAWGLFPALFDMDKAPPETQVDCTLWCQRLRLLPVRLAVQIILAEPAETDERFHAAIWPGVLRWMMFLSRLDDDVCLSLDPSVFQLVGALARDLADFLVRTPQFHVCYGDPEGTQKLVSSLVRLGFFCPTELVSQSVWGILEALYRFHRQHLPLELAAQIAAAFVIDASRMVENGREAERRFMDRFLLLRLLIAEDKTLARQLSEKRCAHWLVACMQPPKAARLLIQQAMTAYAATVDHVLYCLEKLIQWVGIPAANEILSSGYLGFTSSPDFRLLVQWDEANGQRDIDHGEIGLQKHMKQILERMQKFLVWQSFIRASRRPIAAVLRSETYRDDLYSPEMRAFLEIAVIREKIRKAYIRRCGNRACDEHSQGRARMRYVCSRCKFVRYCSRTCQCVDWRAGGHTGCAPAPEGRTLADQQEADFLASEIALPLLQDNARRLKENMPRHCDIVLDFLDGGRGVLKFKEWSTSSVHINLEAGQRRIIITAANGDGHGEAINLLFFLHMSADGELSVRDASGRCRADLVT